MRVPVRLTMPRGSTLRGEGDYNPATGEVLFCASTAAEVDARLQRCHALPRHIHEAVAVIDGREQALRLKDNCWIVVSQAGQRKPQFKRWEIPPPAPRWEIPHLRARVEAPQERPSLWIRTRKKVETIIRFRGILRLWDT